VLLFNKEEVPAVMVSDPTVCAFGLVVVAAEDIIGKTGPETT
jgi:hypothetical protein